MTVSIGFLLGVLLAGFLLGLFTPVLVLLYLVMRADVPRTVG